MKTERRHELETNELADSMAHWIDAVKPYVRLIAGAVIAVVVLIVALLLINQQAATRASEGWAEYYMAFNQFSREKLEDVADAHPGTPVGWTSLLVVADMDLDEGTNELYTDKAVGRDRLRSAVSRYEQVAKEARDPMLVEQATYGLARAHESLGELDKARKEYTEVTRARGDSALAGAAAARLKDLDREDTKKFYDWFTQYEKSKPAADESGTPGAKLPFSLDTLNRSNDLPSSTGTPATERPAAETPATGAETSTKESTPAEAPAEAPQGGTQPSGASK